MTKRAAGPSLDWRESARELAIVMLGVLIALLAQEVMQDWEWRQKVRAAEAAMRRELFWDNGPQVYQRAAAYPCTQAQLDRIRAAVDARKDRREIIGLIDAYKVQLTTYDSLAHDAATASGVSAHMPQDRLNAYTEAYVMMPVMNAANEKEADDLAKLRGLRRAGGPLSDAEAGQVLSAVEELRNDDARMVLGARWAIPALRRLGGELDPTRMNRMMGFVRQYYGACVQDLPPDWPKGRPIPNDL